jgi:hypothetical protein
MAVKFTNNARTTLAADISNSATTATVTSGSVFPVLNAGEYFYCTFDNGTNNEIVKVTARSGNTLTIVRGVDNTTARAFSTDDAAELRATAGLLTDIQENIAAKSANQTVYNATTASSATDYDIGIDPGLESNAMVFLNGVMQHHDTFSFSGSTLTFDTAPSNGLALEVIVDNLINLQSSNLTVDTFTAADVGGNPQVDFVLSDAPAGETNLIVFVDGVFQANDTYTISSTTLSMTDGVTADMVVTVYVMNPVNIGAPSDNTVTSSKLSGNITMPADLTVTGDVAFDSPTFVVDNANSRVGLGTATPSVPVDIVGEVKISSHLNMPDNAIAKFGTGSDLQIYHDGSNSYVSDEGAGNLIVRGGLIALQNAGSTQNLAQFTDGGAAQLFYAGAQKLATTSTGIDVTGTATATNMQVSNGGKYIFGGENTRITGEIDGNGKIRLFTGGTEKVIIDGSNVGIGTDSPSALLGLNASAPDFTMLQSDSVKFRMGVSGTTNGGVTGSTLGDYFARTAGGKMLFSTNDGVTAHAVITSSGLVGIGTSSPDRLLTLQGDNSYMWMKDAGGGNIGFIGSSGENDGLFRLYNSSHDAKVEIHSDANSYFNGGNVGIGETSPDGELHVKGTGGGNGDIYVERTSGAKIHLQAQSANGKIGTISNHNLGLNTNGTTRVTIDTNGNLLVGKTSGPNYNSVGIDLTPLGEIQATGDSRNVATFNRQTTDGDIAVFRKDGTAVGSIGVDSSNNMYFESTASSHTGLTFPDNAIVPRKDGSNSDAGVDLGASSVRFKDLYLSGTANVGKAVVTGAVQSELQLYSSHSYSNNRNWSLITNHFGSGNWGGFSLERSTSTGGTPSEAMFGITLAGLVGIGVGGLSGGAQPSAKLHIKQAANKSEGDSHFRIEGAGYSGFHWLNGTAYYIGQNSNGRQLRMYSGSNEGVGVYLTNGGNSWSSYSDERLKENIQDIGSVTEKIKDIRCVTYNRKDVDDENKHETIGFIAQDFIGKFDQVLDESKVLDSDEETRYSIRYTETIPILMKAIQELSTTVDDLKAEIQELKDNG